MINGSDNGLSPNSRQTITLIFNQPLSTNICADPLKIGCKKVIHTIQYLQTKIFTSCHLKSKQKSLWIS